MASKKKKEAKRRRPAKTALPYAPKRKGELQVRSVIISLDQKNGHRPLSKTAPPANPSLSQQTLVNMHRFCSIAFLASVILGFIFALRFAGKGHWLFFLVSILIFIIGIDKFIVSLRNERELKGTPRQEVIKRLHSFSAHLFLLLSLVGIVFGITFWLKGEWIMLLLSIAAAIMGFDAMHHARKNHQQISF